jgi:hypothetical protein
MRYTTARVAVEATQETKLKEAIEQKKPVVIQILLSEPKNDTILLTKEQIHKLERARLMGKVSIPIKMSAAQIKANTMHKGGFLWALAARLLPALLGGLASAVASKAAEKVMSSKKGRGLYLQKKDKCAKVQLVDGGGLYLSPHPKFHGGKIGLFETEGSSIVEGNGLLLGENSPFKNVPLLNILL